MKQIILLIALVVVVAPFGGPGAFAQTPEPASIVSTAGPSNAATIARPASPTLPALTLANLPEADTLIYINTKRILNEAVPHFLPAPEVASMRQQFADMKQLVGLDPAQVDYLVFAVRFRKPTAEPNFVPPEFMLVASGDFSADALVELARLAGGDTLREEVYGEKKLALFTIDPLVKEAEKYEILKSFAEVAITPLSSSTVGIGTPSYIKAAVDAEQGQGRINPETLNSLMRDPNVLLSIVGLPLNSFAKSFGLLGVEGSASGGAVSRFGDFYAAVTMDQTHLKVRGAMNADNPNTAKIISGLLLPLAQQALSSLTGKSAESILTNFAMTAEGHELMLKADLSQPALVKFVKEQMTKPAPAEVKPEVKKPVKRRVTPRRRRA